MNSILTNQSDIKNLGGGGLGICSELNPLRKVINSKNKKQKNICYSISQRYDTKKRKILTSETLEPDNIWIKLLKAK